MKKVFFNDLPGGKREEEELSFLLSPHPLLLLMMLMGGREPPRRALLWRVGKCFFYIHARKAAHPPLLMALFERSVSVGPPHHD
jgi:hypothetical protein